jgi:hypothetical protein
MVLANVFVKNINFVNVEVSLIKLFREKKLNEIGERGRVDSSAISY